MRVSGKRHVAVYMNRVVYQIKYAIWSLLYLLSRTGSGIHRQPGFRQRRLEVANALDGLAFSKE